MVASVSVNCSSFWKSPRGGGRSSYADGSATNSVVGGVIVDDVVPPRELERVVVVDRVVVLVGGWVAGVAGQ